MGDAIARFIVERMRNYLIENASMLMGVREELEALQTELLLIQGYLKDVETHEKENNVSKEWTKLVLNIAYAIEDVLDMYKPKAEERSQRRGFMRLTNKIEEKMDAYKILDHIKTLKTRILGVTCQRATYGIGNSKESPSIGNTSSFKARQLRRPSPVDQEERVVGLEDDVKFLLAKLLKDDDDGDNKQYMISIYGMGGLGKTALARKLYNSSDVKTRFQYRAWTYVSEEYKTSDMLMRIIRSLGVDPAEEIEKMKMFGQEELEDHLYKLLRGKQYLLVVDDIWEREAWDSLQRALSGNHNGSRVIITTRIRAVAEGVDQRVYAHKLRFLTPDESWNLFEQKAFRNIKPRDQELDRIGRDLVEKCAGLPLAIVVLAGVMVWKEPNEWNDVGANLWRRLKDNNILISTVFNLSFKELQHESKLCFLYLSVFPEDYEIDVEMLIRLLIAEGFVPEDRKMLMEDQARDYIEELIDRSLVEAVRIDRGKVMSCRIHDLLRDEAVKKAKELNFVNVYNEKHASTQCRREVFHHIMDKNYLCSRRVNQQMRSFLLLREQKEVEYVETITWKLKLLRVLNLSGVWFVRKGKKCNSLPDVIGELIHLRYLGIADTFTEKLPAFISNLRLLQTLDASGNSFYRMTDLRKLTSLRHVMGSFYRGLLLGDTVNLRTLRSISFDNWSKLENHELLKNLRYLKIFDEAVRRVPVDFDSFSKLKNLRILELRVKTLKLPVESENAVVIFPSLESLTLFGTNLDEDAMPFLQKFPRLEELVMLRCDYSGAKMSISAQGFARLMILRLFNLILDELQIEEEAMPSLKQLEVSTKSRELTELIPDRLRALVEINDDITRWL